VNEAPSRDTGFIDMSKLIDPARFGQHRGYAFEKLDTESLDGFQDQLKFKLEKTFNIDIPKQGVIYKD